jgi:hypothetical protein
MDQAQGIYINRLAIATVVTKPMLSEFFLLKYSFELFHGAGYTWFVRSDPDVTVALSQLENLYCRTFPVRSLLRPDFSSPVFRDILSEKLNVLEDAWESRTWDAVLFLDADIVVTAEFVSGLLASDAQLILSPHYYPNYLKHLEPIHGRFNAGFLLVRTSAFTAWWRRAFSLSRGVFVDQKCLETASSLFSVEDLDRKGNIGCWRRSGIVTFEPIPPDCTSLHVHFFQPVTTTYELLQKALALHCLEFLAREGTARHASILNRVVDEDSSGWYKTTVR